MQTKQSVLSVILLLLWASYLPGEVVHSTWVGGEFGYWKHAVNWNPPIVPDNSSVDTFTVTIDSNNIGVSEVFVVCEQSRTIDKLDFYGIVIPDVWTSEPIWLTVHDGITNHGRLQPDDFHIDGDFTNVTGASALLDEISIQGNLTNSTSAVIEVEVHLSIGENILNAGAITIIPRSGLFVGAQIQNTGIIRLLHAECTIDQVLDNRSTGVIEGSGVILADQLLQNKGRITAYGGSLAIATKGPFSNSGTLANAPVSSLHIKPAADIDNKGTIQVHALGGIAFDCNLVNETNGVIKLLGGTLAAKTVTQSANATFSGFGGITGDIFVDRNGLIRLTGPTSIVGNVEIDVDATLEISDGTTLVTGHTTNNGTIHMKGGRLIPQGGLTNNGQIIWEPGIYTNVADFNLDGQVNFKDFADFADTWLWASAW